MAALNDRRIRDHGWIRAVPSNSLHILPLLQVAAQEALATEQGHVAKAALLHLHSLVEKDKEAATVQPGDEAMIISNLVRLVLDSIDSEAKLEGQLQMFVHQALWLPC